jgi:hypothetical protein
VFKLPSQANLQGLLDASLADTVDMDHLVQQLAKAVVGVTGQVCWDKSRELLGVQRVCCCHGLHMQHIANAPHCCEALRCILRAVSMTATSTLGQKPPA